MHAIFSAKDILSFRKGSRLQSVPPPPVFLHSVLLKKRKEGCVCTCAFPPTL